MASNDNGNSWTPLCGQLAHAGNNNQDFEQPIYDGTQSSWVNEIISLEDYIGGDVKIAFRLFSDQSVTGDGFYFDDLEILTYGIDVGINEINNKINWNVYPNPANNALHINVSIENAEDVDYQIVDISGKVVKNGNFSSTEDALISIEDLNSGSYFIRITMESGQVNHKLFQKIK